MSRYPLIHSISTVGVIKHYNQDYLLHQKRTDFTGDNGIGKSLLADLLQVLFIADKSKIKFGTESLKKDERQIHTIPYQSNDAYFFINIEKTKNQYLTFGVNISSAKSSPIKIFRVLSNPFKEEQERRKTQNERKKLDGYLIPEDKLLYFKDFLVDETIPRIEDLIKHLRDSKQLFLSFYTTKPEKKELYQFLFEKEILPLDLSIDSHLTAFSKVIQAFSKANTLDIDSDNSLKNFLLENKKTEIEADYKANKKKLDELIQRYNELVELTDALKTKRIFLEDLERKNKEYIKIERLYFQNLYRTKELEIKTKNEKWKNEEATFDSLTKEVQKLEGGLPKLENAKKSAINEYNAFQKSFTRLSKYRTGFDQLKNKVSDFTKLKSIHLPDVSEEEYKAFKFNSISIEEIKLKISDLTEILGKYQSLKGVNDQFNKQTEELNTYTYQLKQQKEQLEKLQVIVNYKKQNTLASKVIKEGKALAKAQETVLLQLLLDVQWGEPNLVKEGLQYVNSLEILKDNNIAEDKKAGGYWLKLGELKTFTKYSNQEQIFDKVDKMKEAFDKKAKELENEILKINRYLNDISNRNLDKIENHDPKVDLSWDSLLPDQRKIEEYITSVAIVKNISRFETHYQEEIDKQYEALNSLKVEIPFAFEDSELENIIDKKSDHQEGLNSKQLDATSKHAEAETKLKSEKVQLDKLNFNPDEIKAEKKELDETLGKLRLKFESKYPDIFEEWEESVVSHINNEELNHDYITKKKVYELGYEDVLKNFPSIIDDVGFREQISNKTYSFTILQRKLLGSSIADSKNIEQALKNANEEKRKLSSTLRQTMLKIFQKTQDEYDGYKTVITRLNGFFRSILISKTYFFQVNFEANPHFSIKWINDLQSNSQNVGDKGELFESDSVENYVESFFKDVTSFNSDVAFSDLLDPKTYFTLETEFKDEEDAKNSGSTGQSYAARVLLGIGRLSMTSKDPRNGLRFLILEEVSNLDESNFNTFPELAEEHGYQIITMTPEPFGSYSTDGWYLHQLTKGKEDKNVNYTPSSSFKTNFNNEQLNAYLKRVKN